MKVSDFTQSALLAMLVTVLDAHYGSAVHHIGDGDGITEVQASEIRAFWQAYLKEIQEGSKK